MKTAFHGGRVYKLWRLNLDLKLVSEDACLRSVG